MTQGRGRHHQGDNQPSRLVSAEDLKRIITGTTPEDVKLLNTKAKVVGKSIAHKNGVSTSQIRNIFGTVRMIEQDTAKLEKDEPLGMDVVRPLTMLRPKLFYQCGRSPNNTSLSQLADILSESIELIGTSQAAFHNFVDFFEAILAYHRYHGGDTK